MDRETVRLEKISIQGFKNVMNGDINFKNSRWAFRANILGLYGQNGSGKTAVIDAIELLRLALCGKRIPAKFSDFVNIDSPHAKLTYQFKIKEADEVYCAEYEFCIRKNIRSLTNTNLEEYKDNECHVLLFNEKLSYSLESGDVKRRMSRLIDTNTQSVFVPKAKYDRLIGSDEETRTDLLVAKKMALAESRSFVFSKELLEIIRRKNKNTDETQRHRFVIERLLYFGNFELFVINTQNSGLISMNALPLTFKYEGKESGAAGSLMIPLGAVSAYPNEIFEVIKKIISSMNVVLTQIIPGLTIGVREIGSTILDNGKIGVQIQLVSCRNGKEIALIHESEGIKKIISVLHLLINVYNQDSFTVAIDELDAGVFEYLLGEILRILSEKGKGQLIFTSHNLRPLETLDRNYIIFTTTNPNNRYIHMTNVKDNNNLRDFYYRDIMLEEQRESVYDSTNNYEIALAFREAGDFRGA